MSVHQGDDRIAEKCYTCRREGHGMVGKHKCFFALQPNGTLNVGGEQKAYEELAQWEERIIPSRDWSGAKASP